jgi:hypothetical protein
LPVRMFVASPECKFWGFPYLTTFCTNTDKVCRTKIADLSMIFPSRKASGLRQLFRPDLSESLA